MGHIVKAAPKGFWKEPVSYIGGEYTPQEVHAILRNVASSKAKGGG